MRIPRRTFLKAGAVAVGMLSRAASARGAAGPLAADLVFTGGSVLTCADRQPVAQALAVRAGRVVAVGSAAEVAPHVGPRTRVVDLRDKCVTPGLIDAHSHPIAWGHMETRFVILRPPKIDSIDALGRELARAAAALPPGRWVVGRGFSKLKEGRYPRRGELDRYVPDHPVQIIDWGGQMGVANTLALKTAGLFDKDTKDPYGGKFLRDPVDGLPNGILVHYPAIYAVHEDRLSDDEQQQCARWAFARFLECGVTCVHDNFVVPMGVRPYVMMERAGRLPLRLRLYPYVRNLETCRLLLDRRPRLESPTFRIVGLKLAVDGYPLMSATPRQRRHLAMPMHPRDQFEQIVRTIHDAGLQVDVHAVGDQGVDLTLDAFEKVAGAGCPRRRHRVEHFPFRKVDTIRRAARLGVPVCTQPTYMVVKADDYFVDFAEFGQDGRRMVETVCPLRTMARAGVHVCFGADVPAFPSHRPLDSIRCAMERKTASGRSLDPSEAVSFAEALKMHTIHAAYAAFDEEQLGSLEAGKWADVALWDRDLANVASPRDLEGARVLSTYVAGQVAFGEP